MTTTEIGEREGNASVKTIEFLGNRLRVLATGLETGGAYTLIEYTAGQGVQGPPPHIHAAQDELTFVLEGELEVRVGERAITASAGSHVVKPRGVPHSFSNPGSAPARFLEITSPAGIERYFEEVAALLAAPSAGPADVAVLLPRIAEVARRHGIQMGGAPRE
ncbi:MAG: cupin domain-containing protein [Chloroflexi bacterium]|nr:cupin domain-containing protein [Chloroflexota bacterium]